MERCERPSSGLTRNDALDTWLRASMMDGVRAGLGIGSETKQGDQVAVISGLNPGEEIVTSGVFKLRNGAAVQVNNKVQPSNNPKPKPEDS